MADQFKRDNGPDPIKWGDIAPPPINVGNPKTGYTQTPEKVRISFGSALREAAGKLMPIWAGIGGLIVGDIANHIVGRHTSLPVTVVELALSFGLPATTVVLARRGVISKWGREWKESREANRQTRAAEKLLKPKPPQTNDPEAWKLHGEAMAGYNETIVKPRKQADARSRRKVGCLVSLAFGVCAIALCVHGCNKAVHYLNNFNRKHNNSPNGGLQYKMPYSTGGSSTGSSGGDGAPSGTRYNANGFPVGPGAPTAAAPSWRQHDNTVAPIVPVVPGEYVKATTRFALFHDKDLTIYKNQWANKDDLFSVIDVDRTTNPQRVELKRIENGKVVGGAYYAKGTFLLPAYVPVQPYGVAHSPRSTPKARP